MENIVYLLVIIKHCNKKVNKMMCCYIACKHMEQI